MKTVLRYGLICLLTSAIFVTPVALASAKQAAQSSRSAPSTANAATTAPMQSGQPTATNPTLPTHAHFIPPAPEMNAAAYILMDANSGKILAQKNSDRSREPASLTKLMTLYVTFNAIKQGLIKQNDAVLISKKAWQTGGSKMFIKAGDQVAIDKLIEGVIVDSGNDASLALAEYVGGSEKGFVTMMNQQANVLGMTNTHFTDPTGLPASDHVTTAADLALLTRALIMHFPQQYQHFKQKWLKYNGIRQPNRNRLLWRYPGADGLKTGHTKAAGFCLIASAQNKNGMRLISVVMGAPSDEARTNDSIALMRYGFRFFDSYRLYQAKTPIAELRVWHGKKKQLAVGIANDMTITLPHGTLKQVKIVLQSSTLNAPIKAGQAVGQVTVSLEGDKISSATLIALNSNGKGGIFRRLIDSVHSKLSGKKGTTSTLLMLPTTVRAPNESAAPAPTNDNQTPAASPTSNGK